MEMNVPNFIITYCDENEINQKPIINSRPELSDQLRDKTFKRARSASPSRSKPNRNVKFAEFNNLETRHEYNADDIPKVPDHIFLSLDRNSRQNLSNCDINRPVISYIPNFITITISNYQNILKYAYVKLFDAKVDQAKLSGTIGVRNIGFKKEVFVRLSLDKWKTYRDINTSHFESINQSIDLFVFSKLLPYDFDDGKSIEFAISFKCGGKLYWDNNSGKNYIFYRSLDISK